MKPNLGENIRKLRVEKQTTQEQLAAHLSISYQAVSKWENNITTPDIFLLPVIAAYFEVSIDELFKVNMAGYRNRAERLVALYRHTGKKEDFEKADAEYEKLFSSGKADACDMGICGTLYRMYSDALANKAEDLFKQASQLGDSWAENQLILFLANRNHHQESICKYEEQLNNDPDNSNNWIRLILSYGGFYGNGVNPEKALEIAKKGLEKFPDNSLIMCLNGGMHWGLKEYDEAFNCWNKSIELDPDKGDGYAAMAFAYEELKQYKEAIAVWEKRINRLEKLGLPEHIAEKEKEIARLKILMEN